MTLEAAIRRLLEVFPFEGYLTSKILTGSGHANIGSTVLRHVPRSGRILDFGCGPLDKTAVVQFLGYQCAGYDDLRDDWHQLPGHRERIVEFARSCGIDFRLAEGRLPFEKESFDMVMAHDVLEHLHDSPRDLLNDLLELVKPEGLLFVTVPNAVNIRKRLRVALGRSNMPAFSYYYWYPGSWRGHVREYVRDDLTSLAHFLDLDVLELRGCDHMLEVLPASVRLPYSLITDVFDGWKDSWLLVARKKAGWMPRKTLPRAELEEILGEKTLYRYDESGSE